jgi:hypothetical protein
VRCRLTSRISSQTIEIFEIEVCRTWRVAWVREGMDEAIQDPDVVTQKEWTAWTVSIDPALALSVRGELEAEIADVFGRRESRLHAVGYLRALCSGLARKNGWRIAEAAGDVRPDGKQRLLYRHKWDEPPPAPTTRCSSAGRSPSPTTWPISTPTSPTARP